jgi:hypothetical protein
VHGDVYPQVKFGEIEFSSIEKPPFVIEKESKIKIITSLDMACELEKIMRFSLRKFLNFAANTYKKDQIIKDLDKSLLSTIHRRKIIEMSKGMFD